MSDHEYGPHSDGGILPHVLGEPCDCGLCNRQPEAEWQPSKKEYLRLEQEIIKLMLKAHEQERAITAMLVLWIITAIFVGFKVLLG